MEDTLQRLLQAELQAEALVTKALARMFHEADPEVADPAFSPF